MDDQEISRLYGTVTLSPRRDVVAGALGTWEVTHIAGELGVDENAAVKLVWRFASDWGHPQFTDPTAPDYASVTTSGPARVEAQYQPKGHVRPWGRCLHVDIRDGSLAPGDALRIVLGDTSCGSPGSRAQTFRQRDFEFRFLVDCHGTWQFVRIPSDMRLNVVAGPAERVVAVAPSILGAGETAWVAVKAEDAWGNPATGFQGEATVTDPAGAERRLTFSAEDAGVVGTEVGFEKPGCCRLQVESPHLPVAHSNPVLVYRRAPAQRAFWGDLHGQSEPTIGTGTIAEYFEFARRYGALDFASHQGNDFQITREQWRETRHQVRQVNESGNLVAFLGYEWSGNPGVGGDRNVLFPGDDEQIHRSSHMQVADKSDADTDRMPVERLFEEFRGREVLTIAHVGGRPADLGRYDADIERLVEIHSAWGTFEWMLTDALALGRKVGVVANSDDHSGRPGANQPGAGHFGTRGGLTCVLAPELTRQAVWDALRARRCYGTSGPRILLDLTVAGEPMGSECVCSGAPTIDGHVWGTAPIERVDIFRGTDIVHTETAPELGQPSGRRIRIMWSGARHRGRARQTCWDGDITVWGNRILAARPYALDSPAEELIFVSDTGAEWRSKTSGDADGVVIDLADPYRGSLHFHSGVVTFTIGLAPLEDMPFVADAGKVDQRVTIEAISDTAPPSDLSFEWADEGAPAGEHAYWVRVVQHDGHRAWSSPVFVTVGA